MKSYLSIALATVLLSANLSFANNPPVFTPENILPAGVDETIVANPYTDEVGKARKGTVAAVVNNIALLNKLLAEPESEPTNKNIHAVTKQIDLLIPSLRVLGLFDFFTVNEWLADYNEQPGRALTAVLYLKQYPHEVTSNTKEMLEDVYQNTTVIPLKNSIEKIK